MSVKDAPSELIRAKDLGAFDRWALPSFDPDSGEEVIEQVVETSLPEAEPEPLPPEDVPVEAVKPLTLEELESIRQEAYNEGFSTGEKDGFHAGQLKAKQEADAALAEKLERLERLMQQLMAPIAEQDQQIEQGMIQLLGQMVEQVIRREVSLDSSQVRLVLREALKVLPMGAENIRIHIHPQDFETVKALRERHDEKWRILEDESLLPGGCRVETEHSRIDATVETRMAQVLKQLFEQQRTQATAPLAADIQIDLDAADEA